MKEHKCNKGRRTKKGKYVDVSEWVLNAQDNHVIVLQALAFVKCAMEIHA